MTCSGFVPSDIRNFKGNVRQQIKTAIRFTKRYFYMLLRGQLSLEQRNIPDAAKKILWINLTAPSLGDALMDTAGRCLLAGRSTTLITRSQNASLFSSDRFFNRILKIDDGDWRGLRNSSFDLIILDSYSPKSIRLKVMVAPKTPFVGLYGFLNAYEVHRIVYSFRRLEYLLGARELKVPMLTPGWALQKNHVGGKSNRLKVALAVGGEWPFRTYMHWPDVVRGLASEPTDIVLLGSRNGLKDARLIESAVSSSVKNLVGKTSLPELFTVLSGCDLFLGADGGLWHIASACGLPSICLHADCQLYDETGAWRSRAAIQPSCLALRAERSVNELQPALIIQAARDLISKLKS